MWNFLTRKIKQLINLKNKISIFNELFIKYFFHLFNIKSDILNF
jgi:hypothetical protein